MSIHRTLAASIALLALAPALVSAQSLDARVASARGSVGFEYETRRNVCGNGSSINVSNDTTPGWNTRRTHSGIHMGRGDGEDGVCETGPARVLLQRTGATVTTLTVSVGGRRVNAETELGEVSSTEAARYLLAIAPKLAGRSGDDAVMGAAIAEGPSSWKRMLEIARAGDASESSRKAAMFWVSQEASAAATAGIGDIALDESSEGSVRRDALFFLAQRRDGEGIPALIRVVRESKSARMRKEAIFHLAQSGDPRALALFESLLAGR